MPHRAGLSPARSAAGRGADVVPAPTASELSLNDLHGGVPGCTGLIAPLMSRAHTSVLQKSLVIVLNQYQKGIVLGFGDKVSVRFVHNAKHHHNLVEGTKLEQSSLKDMHRATAGRPEKNGISVLVLSFMIVVSSSYAASAAPLSLSDYSDVGVISVMPRNPAVKPLVMAIFTKEQRQRMAETAFKKNAFVAQDTNHSR
jgi:hypothetical protein